MLHTTHHTLHTVFQKQCTAGRPFLRLPLYNGQLTPAVQKIIHLLRKVRLAKIVRLFTKQKMGVKEFLQIQILSIKNFITVSIETNMKPFLVLNLMQFIIEDNIDHIQKLHLF